MVDAAPFLEGGRAKHLYERLYCARGQAENHIKAWKNYLAAARTSCHAGEAYPPLTTNPGATSYTLRACSSLAH
jgi:hypothetical protein